jgi:hypothetical protein
MGKLNLSMQAFRDVEFEKVDYQKEANCLSLK